MSEIYPEREWDAEASGPAVNGCFMSEDAGGPYWFFWNGWREIEPEKWEVARRAADIYCEKTGATYHEAMVQFGKHYLDTELSGAEADAGEPLGAVSVSPGEPPTHCVRCGQEAGSFWRDIKSGQSNGLCFDCDPCVGQDQKQPDPLLPGEEHSHTPKGWDRRFTIGGPV